MFASIMPLGETGQMEFSRTLERYFRTIRLGYSRQIQTDLVLLSGQLFKLLNSFFLWKAIADRTHEIEKSITIWVNVKLTRDYFPASLL
jgi:hypothetical protein